MRSSPSNNQCDVLVVGGGNAALCAAVSAAEAGAAVTLLEASPREFRGGNSRHVRNIRYMHNAATDIMTGPYAEDEFLDDLMRVTGGKTDEALARQCIRLSEDAIDWMRARGVRFQPALGGTLQLSHSNAFFLGGGKALVNALFACAEKLGVAVRYEAEVTGLAFDENGFRHVVVGDEQIPAKSVVAASGGFEANIPWLTEAWGPAAENFIVRGSPFNTGHSLRALMEGGAEMIGDPTQCHAVAIDARVPKFDAGIVSRSDSVPFGVMVNRDGVRFYDEGEDFWPKRYAIWGRLIAKQPGQIAYSIIDAKAVPLFMPSIYPPHTSDTISGLAGEIGVDPAALEKTLGDYNAAVGPGTLDTEILDGCRTVGLAIDKTNWARPIDTPPYCAYPLAPGITFTYLSARIDAAARVQMSGGTIAPGVYAAGELMSGNILGQGYLAGFGMTIGTVFGRIAGREAAGYALK
ncbi:MAG: FAD-dependent tricarballylate dehydrogenase TcuA [Rhodospirillales bacterium]|nr:FAD-dependent tricarballylate dehydrogenase TcuA [Rhodospirillales bacterium]